MFCLSQRVFPLMQTGKKSTTYQISCLCDPASAETVIYCQVKFHCLVDYKLAWIEGEKMMFYTSFIKCDRGFGDSLQARQPLLLRRQSCVLYQGKVLFIFIFLNVPSSQAYLCMLPSLAGFFCLIVENMNLFPTPCPLHFPFQSNCFVFRSLKFFP